MRKIIFFSFLFLLSSLVWQCTSDSAPANTEATEEAVPAEEQTTPPIQVVEEPKEVLSSSQTFEKYGDRYAQLHKTVTSKMDAINTAIDDSTSPEKLKNGLKASFAEVAKYEDIEAICQTSKYTSVETIEQFMTGLEMYLKRWGIQ